MILDKNQIYFLQNVSSFEKAPQADIVGSLL